jgi:hypothetical protein
MDNRVDVFAVFPDIDGQVTSGSAPDFATSETPAGLREAVNLVERAKRGAIYATMKAGMKFLATIREEQEFLEYTANQLINLFAMDSAVGRALAASSERNADARVHELLANMVVLTLFEQTRSAIDGAISMAFEGNERRQELAQVRAYLGDPEQSVVPLQRELAGIVAERGGYPL